MVLKGSYADFPMKINVYFLNKAWERQCVIFTESHTFLALYNHSHFIRMHVHNEWLLQKEECYILLPELFFETQDYLFLFCGTFQRFRFRQFFIRDIVLDGD